MNRLRILRTLSWISGFISFWAIRSLWQDAIGQEAYIQSCRDHWADPTVTVPLAVILLLIAYRFHNPR